ncbi:hypothetical protein SCT_0098 [Sulfuricella sp. T08]|uniref:transglutaminase-like cysteine peptidase n=1 Tax=Sulfuricella sp. T08 TaxID=1632857 RepID=UPI0006179705|nr:transglutaminase-like cysteine peptidase [Sulfuricella sp. T08]GAO34718.1 hypothetical protein SCT_0098 [Sulfuricella sp. T08]
MPRFLPIANPGARPGFTHAILLVLLYLTLATLAWGNLTPSDEVIALAVKQYGDGAASRLRKWREILRSDKSLNDVKKLEVVNRFFNGVPYVSDLEHWGKTDYWATPLELLASNGGDCEDYAIAKYFTLRELGVPTERLRITYVTALLLNQGQMKFQGHMVLTYYSSPDAEPLILDNLQGKILLASQRKDLAPVYSFNGDSLWLAKEMSGRSQPAAGADRINLWQDMQTRMQRGTANGR